MEVIVFIGVSLIVMSVLTIRVHALPPPDIIYNVMQQLPQMIAMLLGFFSMLSVGILNTMRLFGKTLKLKKWQWVLLVLGVIIVSIGIGYLLTYFLQQQAFNNRSGE